MLKRILFILLLLSAVFGSNATAQATDEIFAVKKSALTGALLPPGAMQFRKESVPQEIQNIFADGLKSYAGELKQGETEVVVWEKTSFAPIGNSALVKQIEANLKKTVWTYQVESSDSSVTGFSLTQTQPRRAMIGFFIPSDEILILAVTEMLPIGKVNSDASRLTATAKSVNRAEPKNAAVSSYLANLAGRWQSPKLTDTTLNNYGSMLAGDSVKYLYDFSIDGTVERTETAVSIVGACWTESVIVSRGKASVSGNALKLDFAPTTLKFNASCEKKYEKSVAARTETLEFRIKEESQRKEFCAMLGNREVCMNPAN